MQKISYDVIKNNIESLVKKSDFSVVYKLKNGKYLKIFSMEMLKYFLICGIDLEQKVLDSSKYIESKNINIPNGLIYSNNGLCVGYVMSNVKGNSLSDDNLSKNIKMLTDLNRYKKIHKNLEKIVKSEKSLVFPDLCTCDNILLDDRLNIMLIDYDGIQVGPHKSLSVSTTLGLDSDYINNKKYYNNLLFTKNLDKKSLLYLYFLHTFNARIGSVGKIVPDSNEIITIDNIFEYIGFKDYNLYDKVKKLFNDEVDNVYLEDDIDRIARDYKMILVPAPTEVGYIKRLIKK